MLKQIGKYTISERIGRGTYSYVYGGADSQARPVAVKVSTTHTEPEHLDDFQKDLVAAASVLHPNLIAAHDLAFEDDFPYVVMQLAEGKDLGKLLKSSTAPSLAERIRVMQQIASALKAAHERSVFHLDVRPSKIMLGQDGVAKLLDLGLGRLSFDPARVTENGYLIGAPFYMSPERLAAIDTANESCDIWSLGVTFYEWISGRHPFYDDDGDRMIGNIIDAVPEDLTNVPALLNQAILRAIEKDPADRYRRFAELLADLQSIVSDLEREASDGLRAEALKQTASGRWHEARRTAHRLREFAPKQGPRAQTFGPSKQDLETETIANHARPAADVPLMARHQPLGVVAVAKTASPADMTEPAPPPKLEPRPVVQHVEQPAAVQKQPSVAATPKQLQRPQRTAPKIPSMGVRNGASTAAENGSAVSARAQPPPAGASNGARMAAAASASAAVSSSVSAVTANAVVVRETERAPKSEPARPRPTSKPPTVSPQPTEPTQQIARILKMPEPSGFPWARVLGFAIPALLMIGALLFFLQPAGKRLKSTSSSEEAKEISRASRVTKGDRGGSSGTAALSNTSVSSVTGTSTQPGGTQAGVPTATDLLNPTAPKAFDPKSLAPIKAVTPPRRRGNEPLVGLAAPSLTSGSEGTDMPAALPAAMSAPPAPEPLVTPPPTPASAAPSTPTASVARTAESKRESAVHIGGVFAQPLLVHSVKPAYPPAAMQRKTQGIVRFQATIAKDGSVKDIQLLSGDPLLNLAAKQAVLEWKYRPAMLNGAPVEVKQTIVVKFNLSNQ